MNSTNKLPEPIFVTKPTLPPLAEFVPYLEKIWDSKILTNGGPFHEQLERELCEYLQVEHLSLFSNGTIALITALQALGISGEVITTPYSFVATAHSLLWNGITPVFVDVDPETLNLDPAKVEAAITEKTSAILPVHCYGHPCDVDALDEVAQRHGLKIIYDAAHAFGVKCHCGSVLQHGELSVLSLHATKVFNTFEGGAIVCPDLATKRHIDNLKNFGFVDEVTVVAAGINGKMSEMNAALGIVQLKRLEEAIARRGTIDAHYRQKLGGVRGITCLRPSGESKPNFAYFPVLIGPEFQVTRDTLYKKLREQNIFARRYFYPLISEFPMYKNFPSASPANLPNAFKAAQEVLCLPIYPDLEFALVDEIVDVILSA
jgi:dTDP-4-amino-4,6-dideoxygalactose transaminase